VRAVLALVVAVTVAAGVAGTPLYLAALAVGGVSRFVLAGLSAALPHVVARHRLVEANVVATTAGAGVAALGGATAIGARALFGADDSGSALTAAVAAAGPVLAAVLAAGFAARVLGPDRAGGGSDRSDHDPSTPRSPRGGRPAPDRRPRGTLTAVAHGLVDGARATARTPTVAASFLALAAHRLAFGVTTLLTLMLFRSTFTGGGVLRAGMAGVGEAVALAAAGLGVAALLTPWLVHRLGRARTVRVALLTAAGTQLALAAWLTLPAVLAAAFLLGAAGQVVKLCADAGVQGEVRDDARGRVFALYDAVFNVCYVLAAAAAALLGPPDGYAPWLVAATAGVYVLGLLAHDRQLRRAR
jgi:hypothetical protein